MKAPPNNGPATDAIPHIPPIKPNAKGLCRSGRVYARITIEPENSPAVPMPATARPTMKAVELGATAHTRLPTSKTNTAKR